MEKSARERRVDCKTRRAETGERVPGMPNHRTTRLDALEARLIGPKKIALFGHRDVGKTTLLAMFYRQAAAGKVPGVRLAAADARSALYLAEKIAQIESGEPMAGTLAETELSLRLYHGPALFELIVKDYQGEHVTLGSEEPIQEFFAGCDAVLLCLDPEGSANPADRRRRQQEIENLLERYIDRSEDLSTDRPVALLLTKFDRVLAAWSSSQANAIELEQNGASGTEAQPAFAGPFVERLVEERYGMTRHALRQHAPEGAIFAVSSFGAGATGNRPPQTLSPLGLEGPLGWLADQLESRDRARWNWLWELAPADRTRLERCVAAYERRHPRSNGSHEFRARLTALGRKRTLRAVDGSFLPPRCSQPCSPATIFGASTEPKLSSEIRKTLRPWSLATGRACWPSIPRSPGSGPPCAAGTLQAGRMDRQGCRCPDRHGKQQHRQSERPPRPDQGPGASARPRHSQGRAGARARAPR